MTMMYGTRPPRRLPPTFSGGATFFRATSKGFAIFTGRPVLGEEPGRRAVAKLREEIRQLVRRYARLQLPLVVVDRDRAGPSPGRAPFESRRDLDRRPHLLVGDETLPARGGVLDLELADLLELAPHPGRVLPADHHDPRGRRPGLAHDARRRRSQPEHEERHEDRREYDHRDERPAVAQRVLELLRVDGADRVAVHAAASGATILTKQSSRSACPVLARSSASVPSALSAPP
jgi:hypothetical protein